MSPIKWRWISSMELGPALFIEKRHESQNYKQ